MEMLAKFRWILVVGVILFFLVFVGWGLSSLARNMFGDSGSTDSLATTGQKITLDGVRSARYRVDGPVVASSEHRSYSIEATSSVVVMKVYSDYGQKVIAEKSYTNNQEAFDALINSLEAAQATARYEGTNEDDDIADRGICPEGRRYIIELDDDIRRWTTSCDRKQGTAAGKMTTMRSLFTKQVPDFSDLTRNTGLSQ